MMVELQYQLDVLARERQARGERLSPPSPSHLAILKFSSRQSGPGAPLHLLSEGIVNHHRAP